MRSRHLVEAVPVRGECGSLLRAVLLVLAIVPAGVHWVAAQQGGGVVSPKPPSNPLTLLLKEKPKVPVAEQSLPAALQEPAAVIPLPDVAGLGLRACGAAVA